MKIIKNITKKMQNKDKKKIFGDKFVENIEKDLKNEGIIYLWI